MYDQLGLLRPAQVDMTTGYRWYSPMQITRARTVGLLRQLEMPLALIADVLDQPPQQAAASVRDHAAAGVLAPLVNGPSWPATCAFSSTITRRTLS